MEPESHSCQLASADLYRSHAALGQSDRPPPCLRKHTFHPCDLPRPNRTRRPGSPKHQLRARDLPTLTPLPWIVRLHDWHRRPRTGCVKRRIESTGDPRTLSNGRAGTRSQRSTGHPGEWRRRCRCTPLDPQHIGRKDWRSRWRRPSAHLGVRLSKRLVNSKSSRARRRWGRRYVRRIIVLAHSCPLQMSACVQQRSPGQRKPVPH